VKKIWAIVAERELLDFEFGDTAEEAIEAYAQKAHMSEEDAGLLVAIDGDRVRDEVEVPGRLLSALEYGPEFAFGPRESAPEDWEEFFRAVKALWDREIRLTDVMDWVRVDGALDLWAPVVR